MLCNIIKCVQVYYYTCFYDKNVRVYALYAEFYNIPGQVLLVTVVYRDNYYYQD